MKRLLIALATCAALAAVLGNSGCSKERIVESTEYIKEVEYVQLPGDTVLEIRFVYDTVSVTDTVWASDTVMTSQSVPNQFLAITALQYYNDPLVIQFAQQNFGLNDGWIFYLSDFQLSATAQSANVYDLYGYIDFWAPDWSGFYPLEFLWRLTYQSGDAGLPGNWVMSEPPSPVAGYEPGIRLVPELSRPVRSAR